MNLWFRLCTLLARDALRRGRRLGIDEEALTPFFVWPTDLDTNVHMNNGRYMTLMDLGRLDFMAQLGMMWPSFKQGLLPVLGTSQMIFLRPLLCGQRFCIGTRLVFWDAKWFVMQQRFIHQERTVAQALVRGVFRRGGQTVSPAQAMQLCGHTMPPAQKQAPPHVAAWLSGLAQQRDRARADAAEPTKAAERQTAPAR